MPAFIVRSVPATKDGSSMGAGIVMVHAPSAEAAKIDGANQLGVRVTDVIAEPYADPFWAEHR